MDNTAMNKHLKVIYFLPGGELLDTDNVYVPLSVGNTPNDLFSYVSKHLRYNTASYVILDTEDGVAPYFKSRLVIKGQDLSPKSSFF